MYLEKKTQSGYLYQVNKEKLTFQLFYNGKPVIDSSKESRARNHNIPFLFYNQEKFSLKPNTFENVEEDLLLFPVKNSQLQVEVVYKGVNPIPRTLKVPMFEGLDSYLVKTIPVNFSEKFSPYKDGPSWMLIDWEDYKNNLISLRLAHSGSTLYIFRSEELNFLEEKIQSTEAPQFTRASDLAQSGQGDDYSHDPVFMARVYLRELDWVKVKKIAFDFALDAEKIFKMVQFLKTMREKSAQVAALQGQEKNIQSALDYYSHLRYILSFDIRELEGYLEKSNLKNETILLFQKIVMAQKNFIAQEGDTQKLNYLNTARNSLEFLKKT